MDRDRILRQLRTLQPIIEQLLAIGHQTATLKTKLAQLEAVLANIEEDRPENVQLAK